MTDLLRRFISVEGSVFLLAWRETPVAGNRPMVDCLPHERSLSVLFVVKAREAVGLYGYRPLDSLN